jgi:ArsR family transcriptional regulator, arsenate/arsenite/antimonite-responsive transcriptional repressor
MIWRDPIPKGEGIALASQSAIFYRYFTMKEAKAMSVPSTNEDIAATMRALGHPVRLDILTILASRSASCCCNDVTDCLSLAQSTVSQHLKVLLDAGIIEREPRGTRNNYRVRTDRLAAFSAAFASYLDTLSGSSAPCADQIVPATLEHAKAN